MIRLEIPARLANNGPMGETVESLDAQIRSALGEFAGLSLLVVFGSRARLTHRPDSDLDVAILATEEPESRWRFQVRVARTKATDNRKITRTRSPYFATKVLDLGQEFTPSVELERFPALRGRAARKDVLELPRA